MSQTLILKDLLSKFLDRISSDFDLTSLSLSEKWSHLSDSLDTTKTPTDLPSNPDSSFISTKPLKKQQSLSNEVLSEPIDVANDESKSKYYVLNKTTGYLQRVFGAEGIEHLGLNSYFLSTFVLEMGSSNELLIKCVAVSHFISLIMESFSSENHPSMSDVYNLVNNRQVLLTPTPGSIFSEEQLRSSFLSNYRKILSLRAKAHVSFTKLAKSFAYLIWQKPVFLESLVLFLKELMVNTLNRSPGFIEKEMMQKIILNVWSEPRRDLLKILAETLNRTIEIYQVKENRLEQCAYKPNLTGEEKKVVINNKISLLAGARNDAMNVSLILNISEKECFERLENLSKEEIAFLEEETISNVPTSKSMNLIPPIKEKVPVAVLNYTQEWKKSNSSFARIKEVFDLMNFNSEKMNHAFQSEKIASHPTNNLSINGNIVNPTEFKENIIPSNNDKYSGNKVERIEIMDRTRDKSRSRSPMIYYNQQNPYGYDNRLKTITTITSGTTYANPNPVLIDNRVRRHYTTNHLPTIGNNIFSFN